MRKFSKHTDIGVPEGLIGRVAVTRKLLRNHNIARICKHVIISAITISRLHLRAISTKAEH